MLYARKIMIESGPQTIEDLHELTSRPSKSVLDSISTLEGDVLVLGAAGKMGFHLSLMIQRALRELRKSSRIWAVSRFGDDSSRKLFSKHNIECLPCDLCSTEALRALPEAPNVFFLAGVKFGTTHSPDLLQEMNVEMPTRVAHKFRNSSIVALSTGCVYSFAAPSSAPTEESPTKPVGDYARSCIGRESSFTEISEKFGTQVSLVRLNYSNDLRYGVLVDIAHKVLEGEAVDVGMGYVNVIWQGDASEQIIRSLSFADSPPWIINVTGEHTMRVRDIAKFFGQRFERDVTIEGEEAPTAWISDSSKAVRTFGPPRVDEERLLHWVADWLEKGGETLGKPTHFENRDGDF